MYVSYRQVKSLTRELRMFHVTSVHFMLSFLEFDHDHIGETFNKAEF
jgi:hypothetical protein